MSTVARKIAANPSRTASEAWAVITDLLSESGTDGRSELSSVEGIAASLIADECFRRPAIVSGCGPRVRIYCKYDEEAVEGNDINENVLNFNATEGDWAMSLPCHAEDLAWVRASLKKKSTRVTARDLSLDGSDEAERAVEERVVEIDVEGFLNS